MLKGVEFCIDLKISPILEIDLIWKNAQILGQKCG